MRSDERATRSPRRNERGMSMSVFVMVAFFALILVAGLVIDGGQQVTAARQAQSAAAAAARAGEDAAAGVRLGGHVADATAQRAATTVLRGSPGVTGRAIVTHGHIDVRTQATAPTIFLSLIHLNTVTGHGRATGELKTP